MLEAATIMGSVSAVLLLVAVAAWVKLLRGPELQRLDGRAAPDIGSIEVASQLLVVAVGLSAFATILVVVG